MPKHVNINAPTSWNDLSGRSLLGIAWVLLNSKRLINAQLRAFCEIIELRWWQISRQWFLFFADDESAERMREAAEWIWQDNTLTKQLLPQIRVGVTYLYGPADRLKNLTFIEFVYAYNLYIAYKNYKKEERLNQLIAVLYRPKQPGLTTESRDYQGDLREPFNNHLVDARAEKIGKLPEHYKFAILMFFEGCFSRLVSDYDQLFTKEENSSEAAGGLKEIIHRLSGSTFGNYAETSRQNIYDVFDQLNINVKDKKEHERELAQAKRGNK